MTQVYLLRLKGGGGIEDPKEKKITFMLKNIQPKSVCVVYPL